MASIHLQGTLLDTLGEVDVGAIMTWTHLTNTGETIATTKVDLIIPPDGFYSIDVEYGQIRIDYTTRFTERFIATVVVNSDSTATTIPELLNAAVPVTDPVILEMQGILADATAAAVTSEAFADQLTTTDLIGSVAVFAPDTNFRTKGYLTSGDGGGSHWVQNGVTAQPVSQSPADLDDNLLNDGNGNQWALVPGQVVNYSGTQWYPLPFGGSGNGGYLFDSSGWVYISLINDLSQVYEFATVALYKAFTTEFPVGKTIKLLDRGAEFTVITGTGTATEYKIIASTEVSQSIDLIITNGISLAAFGVDLTGVADSTLALQAVADTRLADGVVLAPWTGSITLSDTVQFREVGVDFIGSGMETATLTMTDNTKFALDFFAISSGKGTFKAGDFKIVAKYGIFTRWDLATDFENTANPIKKYDFERINCVGEYANTTDPLAGGVLVPTWSELTALGVGIHIAMNYRTTVRDCEFSFYGIGLNSIGSTLCEFSHNRFINNARNLHEERTLWSGSAFGLGADNIISQNDFLDATRIGGTTFINTFGNKFINNYTEHLDRGGQLSTATLLYLVNASHTTVRDNHFNPNLSVIGSNPYIEILQDGSWIGEASNNRIHGNKLTPQDGLEDAVIQVTITEYDARYPVSYYFYDNADFNRLDIPYVIDKGSIDKGRLSFDNLDDLTELGGNVSTNTLIFTEDVTLNSWHLPSTEPGAGTASLTFKLYLENYDLSNSFEFVITADDNATGNGRLNLNIQDETGFVYNATAFTGVTSITTTVVPFTGGREANKVFDVNFTNMAFSKVYNFYIRAV